MSELNQRVEYVDSFRGYNHNLKISDREFWDTKNITADYYPLLSTRSKRFRLRRCKYTNDPGSGEVATGLYAHNKLCYVDNDYFAYDGIVRLNHYDPDYAPGDPPTGGVLPATGQKRHIVGMGAYVIIFPDKYIYDTVNNTLTPMEATFTTSTTAEVTLVTWDSRSSTISKGSTAPTATDGKLWHDTSVTPNVLRRYSADAGAWLSVPTFYIRIKVDGIADNFRRNDGVTISGFNNDSLNGSFTLYGASGSEDWILISGTLDSDDGTGTVTITRSVPDLDFVCEWENRLWGCKSGTNEIYASALGDPKNWNQFAGISTDSYVVNVGSPGNWTGCCVYNGHPMFFKENIIYVIYGTQPSNFQISTIVCRGVEAGSEQSLCNVYGTLYYKSPFDICAFNGGYPQTVSYELGHVKYKNGVFGANGKKLYVTMQDSDNAYHTFTYDTEYGIWCKEDDFPAQYYAAYGDDLFAIAEDTSLLTAYDYLWSMNGDNKYLNNSGRLEGDFDWYAETGDIELITPDHEYVSKIQLRIELGDVNDSLRVSVKYDTDPEWVEKYSIQKVNKRNIFIPIIPQRCQRMRIRIEGTGEAKIWTLAKTIEGGSELKNDTI